MGRTYWKHFFNFSTDCLQFWWRYQCNTKWHCKWRHLMAKFVTHNMRHICTVYNQAMHCNAVKFKSWASGKTCWPNLQPTQMAPTGGQICKCMRFNSLGLLCHWHFLVYSSSLPNCLSSFLSLSMDLSSLLNDWFCNSRFETSSLPRSSTSFLTSSIISSNSSFNDVTLSSIIMFIVSSEAIVALPRRPLGAAWQRQLSKWLYWCVLDPALTFLHLFQLFFPRCTVDTQWLWLWSL